MHMIKRYHIGIGLFTILFLLLFSSVNVKTVYGATVSELREFIGVADEKKEDTDENNYEVIIENEGDSSKNSESSSGTSSIDHLELKLVGLQVDLDQCIKENASSIDIVSIADQFYATYIDKEEAKKSQYYSNVYDSINNSSLTDSNYSESSIKDSDFSIGSIGSSTPSIVDGPKYIVTPWGYILNSDGSTSEKNLGVDFGASEGANILAQWNGVVTNVEKDSITGGSTVTIYHGNGLYTKYSHIKALNNITVGYEVYQKECIGTCMDTTYAEPYKDNHVFFQVSLDGEYINPLIVYGDNGKTLYEYWYKTHSEVNVVEEGEEYFIEESIEDILNPENYIHGSADEVIYPDFNME